LTLARTLEQEHQRTTLDALSDRNKHCQLEKSCLSHMATPGEWHVITLMTYEIGFHRYSIDLTRFINI
jgi:hypothetical protein